MGGNALLCGLLCMTLPETANQPTQETVQGDIPLTSGDETKEGDSKQNEDKAALMSSNGTV